MSIYLIGAWFYVFKRRPISKGGGSAFSRSPFPNLIIFNKPHYATSGRTVSRSVEFWCVLVCVSGSGALSLSRRLETVRPRPAGVPMSSAHVRIGGENPLFPVSELEWTWDNCGRDRERERKERASSPSPSTHKHDGTTRPLINASVFSPSFYGNFLSGSAALNMVLIRIQGRNYSGPGTFSGECFVSDWIRMDDLINGIALYIL